MSSEDWDVLVEIVESCGLSRWLLASTIRENLDWLRPNPRELYPVEQGASVTDHKVEVYSGCGVRLCGDDPHPIRHQILEMPPIVPIVEEHRLHAIRCTGCGTMNRASLQSGVMSTGFGPGVEGTIATLVAECRLSHRLVVAVMRDLCGVRIGLGTVSNLLRRVSASTARAVEEAHGYVRAFEGAKHVDETGWKHHGSDGTNEKGSSAWLWVVGTEKVTVFKATLSRAQSVARELLGETPRGTLVFDRYLVYQYARPETRQVCWSHLSSATSERSRSATDRRRGLDGNGCVWRKPSSSYRRNG